KIKDTQDTAGEDTFTLDGTTLKYQKNTTENVSRHILLNFEVEGASAKVNEALRDDGSIGRQKKAAELTEAKALLRQAINTVLESDIDNLKTYTSAQENTDVKGRIKNILKLAKDEKLTFLDNGGQGINSKELTLDGGKKAKIILKKTASGAELDIIYDSTGTDISNHTDPKKLNKFVLTGNDVTFTEATEENNKLKALAAVDGVKTKIESALNAGSNLNLTVPQITKAKVKVDLYQTLVTNLPKVLTKDKIDELIKAGTTGIANTELKAIVDEAKKLQEDVTATINGVNNENITLKIKADSTIEISKAGGKKDTITLTGDKFKITTDNKVAKPVLQELAEIKNTLGENPFNAAIEEAKKKIVKEGDHVLT
ncbi:hypothetical protein, partial [Campylobacter pinnipediorum]